jgi:DNA processing protein
MELSLSAVYAKEKKSAPRSTLNSGNCEIFDNLHKFSLEKDELLVYGCLGLLPTGFEELLEKTGLDIQALSQILAALLQKHRIEEVFKNHYKIITE